MLTIGTATPQTIAAAILMDQVAATARRNGTLVYAGPNADNVLAHYAIGDTPETGQHYIIRDDNTAEVIDHGTTTEDTPDAVMAAFFQAVR